MSSTMNRVDFHSNVPDKLAYACRLARKAYMAGNKVVVLAQDAAQLDALNTAMWTISATDFLPHVLAGDPLAAQTPIILTDDAAAELPHHDILVNLSQLPPRQLCAVPARLRDRFHGGARCAGGPPALFALPQAERAADALRGG